MDSTTLDLSTTGSVLHDLTAAVRRFCDGRGDGLCNVFVPHATAGLAVVETGAGSDADLEDLVERLLPRDDRYRHQHGSPGHGADHLVPALFPPSLTIPVVGGQPGFGTWQSLVLVDPNPDNPDRKVRLSFLGS